jgi:predicted esterase
MGEPTRRRSIKPFYYGKTEPDPVRAMSAALSALVVGPAAGRSPLASLIVLHGFTMNGRDHSRYWLPRLRQALSPPVLDSLRIVFLTAPKRRISCYPGNPTLHAWHDYLTDHGGREGRPDLEEEINEQHLVWCRENIHASIASEAELVGGINRVALLGESQGACVALDAALTFPAGAIAGVFSSHGQLYRMSPTPPERTNLHVAAFHGAADSCIGAGLALRSYSRLLVAGYSELQLHVEPNLGHVQRTKGDVEMAIVARTLFKWGLLSNSTKAVVPASGGQGASAGGRESREESSLAQEAQPPAPQGEGEELSQALQKMHISTGAATSANVQQSGVRQGGAGADAPSGRNGGARWRRRRKKAWFARVGGAEGGARDERVTGGRSEAVG